MEFHKDSRTYSFTKDLDCIKEEEVYNVYFAHCSGDTRYRKYIKDRSERRAYPRYPLEDEVRSNKESKEGEDKEYVRGRLAYLFEKLEKFCEEMLHGKDHKSN